jgi:hypothetical protein
VTGSRLVFSQCCVSDHFLVLFNAPSASLISFSIPTLAAIAGTIPSRAGYIQSMLNILISPHMIPLEFLRYWHMLLGFNALTDYDTVSVALRVQL